MDKPTATDLIIDAICNDNNNPIQRDRCNTCNKRVLDNQKTCPINVINVTIGLTINVMISPT